MIDIPAIRTGPTTPESFIADRQNFWTRFTHFVTYAAAAVIVLLVLLAVFLV